MPEPIREKAETVMRLRMQLGEKKAELKALKDAWEEEHALLILAVGATEDIVGEEEAALRDLAIIAFKETGNKKPGPGLGIREGVGLEYDKEHAFRWAKEKEMALELNTKAFEAIVAAQPDQFRWVTRVPTATATITRDLEAALKES